ncbi:beta-1,3-glucosyltransferase isoform X1 [Bacillus rossius redtenbacheri]|uniref:beta-1,3-glucosyltransferase isoform X1 n=1 Tax=Bacillus rossius redtenbacheri TaxID=93214 RepID=UPI002FDCCE3C
MNYDRNWEQLFMLLTVSSYFLPVKCLAPCDVVFVVLSQGGTSYTETQAELARKHLLGQSEDGGQDSPVIYLTHEEFQHPGSWTVLPMIQTLNLRHGTNASWVVFGDSQTRFKLRRLLNHLAEHDKLQEMWLGRALHDREATIIHHFAFADNPQLFKYPHISSGFAMSRALLNRLSARLASESVRKMDFSIDPAHELALFVRDGGRGPSLTPSEALCLHDQPQCASYVSPPEPCGEPIPKKSMYFAVKTCKKFHTDRVPIVKRTWAKHAVHLGFFSEADDETIPTINVGVPNTEQGHCGKTTAILRHVAARLVDMADVKWVVLVDDDTILSVGRLQQLLACFDASRPLALGERYGYRLLRPSQGYNYLTGGAGVALGRDAVASVAASDYCRCSSPSAPDDMFLGVCLARLGVPVVHSPLFHQARPVDYAPEYLAVQSPVSFHKHWMIDPVSVYERWFRDVDKELAAAERSHLEL